MDLEVFKESNYKISNWSGGKTTELYIYPKNSEYNKRNFLFRLSSATVLLKESNFTELKGVKRHLVVISGNVKLVHENKYSKDLKAFEQDSFMGEWKTKSYSEDEVEDFNLMTKDGCYGQLKCIEINSREDITVKIDKNSSKRIKGLYVPNGKIEVVVDKNKYVIDRKEMILLTYEKIDDASKIKISTKHDRTINIIEIDIILK